MCIFVILKITENFVFIPPILCSGVGGTIGVVCGPRLRTEVSTPDVFFFAKRGGEIIFGILVSATVLGWVGV